MKVLHVIPDLNIISGGPPVAVVPMVASLNKLGVETHLAYSDMGLETVPTTGIDSAHLFKFKSHYLYRKHNFPLKLKKWLFDSVKNYDLVHIHSYFNFTQHYACSAARLARVPYIIRPAGILMPWSKEYNLRKKLWLKHFDSENLKNTEIFHVTSKSEQADIASLVSESKIRIITHGVEVPSNFTEVSFKDGFFNLLFLSRIHKKKNLELLIRVFNIINTKYPNLRLNIAGATDRGEEDYLIQLKNLVEPPLLGTKVIFLGLLKGTEKIKVIQKSHLLVLLSYQENFGNAVAEVLANGRAVLISKGVALSDDVKKNQLGWIVEDLSIETVRAMLDDILKDPNKIIERGQNAREYCKNNLSWDLIAQQLRDLYRDVIKK